LALSPPTVIPFTRFISSFSMVASGIRPHFICYRENRIFRLLSVEESTSFLADAIKAGFSFPYEIRSRKRYSWNSLFMLFFLADSQIRSNTFTASGFLSES
jgi:hypothetical protein